MLAFYHYLHAARADLLVRLDRADDAVDAYRRAIDCCDNDTERVWLTARLETIRPS